MIGIRKNNKHKGYEIKVSFMFNANNIKKFKVLKYKIMNNTYKSVRNYIIVDEQPINLSDDRNIKNGNLIPMKIIVTNLLY